MTPFVRHLTRDVARVTLSCHIFLRAILTAVKRCWAGDDDPLMLAYHDREWGVPLHGDRELFAKLVSNARAFLEFRAREGSFDAFLWSFVGHTPRQYRRRSLRDLPARSRESDRMSAALTERG